MKKVSRIISMIVFVLLALSASQIANAQSKQAQPENPWEKQVYTIEQDNNFSEEYVKLGCSIRLKRDKSGLVISAREFDSEFHWKIYFETQIKNEKVISSEIERYRIYSYSNGMALSQRSDLIWYKTYSQCTKDKKSLPEKIQKLML
jgi:flagellar basal body rod protein FlgC